MSGARIRLHELRQGELDPPEVLLGRLEPVELAPPSPAEVGALGRALEELGAVARRVADRLRRDCW